MAAPSPFMYYQ